MDDKAKMLNLINTLKRLNPQSNVGGTTSLAQTIVDNPDSVSDSDRAKILTPEQLQLAVERMKQNDVRAKVLNKIYLDRVGRGEIAPMPDSYAGTLEQYLSSGEGE